MGPLRHSMYPENRSCFAQMKIECTVNINAEAVNLKTINLMKCANKSLKHKHLFDATFRDLWESDRSEFCFQAEVV